MALTAKQENYCQLRASVKNKSDSYRGSYSCSRMKDTTVNNKAYELEKNGQITARIIELQAPAIKNVEITAEYILETIVDGIERCKQATPVINKDGKPVFVENSDGEFVPAYTFNANGLFKGADMLMKYQGLYEVDNSQKAGEGGKINDNATPQEAANTYADMIH